jgi:hypothetical protein
LAGAETEQDEFLSFEDSSHRRRVVPFDYEYPVGEGLKFFDPLRSRGGHGDEMAVLAPVTGDRLPDITTTDDRNLQNLCSS